MKAVILVAEQRKGIYNLQELKYFPLS